MSPGRPATGGGTSPRCLAHRPHRAVRERCGGGRTAPQTASVPCGRRLHLPVSMDHEAPVMRIHLWEHTCCNTVRWSPQLRCDLCGTEADYYSPNVPIEEAMRRLHRKDEPAPPVQPRPVQPPPVEPSQARPASSVRQSPTAPGAPLPATPATPAPARAEADVPPAGRRPHRPDDEAEPAAVMGKARAGHGQRAAILAAGVLAILYVFLALTSPEAGELIVLVPSLAATLVVVAAPALLGGGRRAASRTWHTE